MAQLKTTEYSSWFESSSTNTLSSFILGALLIITGASVLSSGYVAGLGNAQTVEFFPAATALILLATGVLLVVLAYIFRSMKPLRWDWRWLGIACAVVGAALAIAHYFQSVVLNVGMPVHAVIAAFPLCLLIALAGRSHLRALGMVLLGLLLGSVGLDLATGQARFTFGIDGLMDGIDKWPLLFGLFIVADATLILVSPRSWLASLSFVHGNWQRRPISNSVSMLLRLAAIISVLALVPVLFVLVHGVWLQSDIVTIGIAAVFGLACKLLYWNRLAFAGGFLASFFLERYIKFSLLISGGAHSVFFGEPTSVLLIGFCAAAIIASFVLWVLRMKLLGKAVT